MKNCKEPNNGGNVIVRENGEIVLKDQSANVVSRFKDWSSDIDALNAKIDSGSGNSIYAHTMALYYQSTQNPSVGVEFDASGIRIKPHASSTSTNIAFEVELVDPTKLVFSTQKPIFYSFRGYNSSYHSYLYSSNPQYCGKLVTPQNATDNIVLDILNDWQSFGTDRCIIEVWAQLEPVS